MTHARNGHSAPLPLTAGLRQEAPDSERALLELQADVLALVDETLLRTAPVDRGRSVTLTTRREDSLGQRLRRSVMFADANEF